MEFYDELVDKSQDIPKAKNPAVSKAAITQSIQKKMFWGEYDAITLTMLYLKVLHDMVKQDS